MSRQKRSYKETMIDGMYIIENDPSDFELKGSTRREMLANLLKEAMRPDEDYDQPAKPDNKDSVSTSH
ncbi:hypothetical protein JMG10_05905 [Nostoc ellipsosporum NOK]|nr:hypothetical protein [Nostoc ellipsosporum NOK]